MLLRILLATSSILALCDCCAKDVKFKEDHPRRKEHDEQFLHNMMDLKRHEEVLLKAVETLKQARKADEPKNEGTDYKAKIAQIEKELRQTKEDHARLISRHESYLRDFERPKTWSDTISKWTGDAFGRMLYNAFATILVVLVPFVLRPMQRRWLLRRQEEQEGREALEEADDVNRLSVDEVRRLAGADRPIRAQDKKND
ncbi:unnamed protein product [Caenorhabditis auriculariae]|uniref:Tail-anchored protein insertion receptor WRB n=1 Tax=Caenorhabditis auriculariae TaxID=2777116 RepID=A0A8S1GRS4_9PELO|nr:unnamed protein product [Caenorhabditis auriculariae]